MAISRMQKLSLLLPKERVDDLLLSLQKQELVEIYDLKEKDEWQEAFDAHHLTDFSSAEHDQLLAHLKKRTERIESLIKQLEAHLPAKKLLEKLKEEPLTLTFEDLESHGQIRDEDQLITRVKGQLQALSKAENSISEAQIEYQRLEPWKDLQLTPKMLANFHHIHGVIGTIPNSDTDQVRHSLMAHPDFQVQEVYTGETEQGLIIFYKSGDFADLQGLLNEQQFKVLEYDRKEVPAAYLEELQLQIKGQQAVVQEVLSQLANSQEELNQLKYQMDYLLNQAAREEIKKALASTNHLVVLEGWIEAHQLAPLQTYLDETFGSQVLLEVRDVTEEDWEDVPIQLRNHRLVEPFELVTEMYALPKYYEKDPTPILSLFYFVFFGMMVADIGYGLLLFLATSLALKAFSLAPSLAKNLRFFRLLGVAVMIWGAVYGSFFGFELPFALISTTTDAMTILILSVVFGFITVLVGLFLGGLKNVRLKDYTEAYNSGFAWVLILLGLLFLAVGNLLPNFAYLAPIGQWLAILNAMGILVVSIVSARKITGLAAGLFNLYNVSGYVGDLVSFTRLMALGLSGASIGSAFNLIVNLLPPVGRFTVGVLLFLLLHAINMFLSFLSGYVHGARLIFVEFFGKFYEGGGKPFKPLKPAEHYVKTKK